MSENVKIAPQLRIGLLNEILFEGMFIRMDPAPWKFFGWSTILLLCRGATFRWDTF
jgi:hypothetical protein